MSSPWKKIEEMLKQKFKSYEEKIKIHLAANNGLLSKRINELNGKVNDLQASIESYDEVNLVKFKVIDWVVSRRMNGTFRNHAKKTDDHLYEIEEKLRYLHDSSQRNNLRIEAVEEEEPDCETWDDQCKEKVSSILKSKLKLNNVKIKQSHRKPRRKRSHNKDKSRTIVFKLHSYEARKHKTKCIPVERS